MHARTRNPTYFSLTFDLEAEPCPHHIALPSSLQGFILAPTRSTADSSDTMDQRELTRQVQALSKAIAQNEPAEGVISLMNSLKNASAPSEEVLRVSRGAFPPVATGRC